MCSNNSVTQCSAFGEFSFSDSFFEIEETFICSDNADLSSPINIINSDLNSFNKTLKIGHLNARSVSKHIDELRYLLLNTNFDIFAVSESWLNKNTPKNRYHVDGYNVVRKDRHCNSGGGVCVYIKSDIKYKCVDLPYDGDQPEMLCVQLNVSHNTVAVCVLYKPPKIPYGIFEGVGDVISYLQCRYEHCIILGDFNVNLLNADSYATLFFRNHIIQQYSLTQLVVKPTRITQYSESLIDLILVFDESKVLFSNVIDVPGISDHCCIYVAYSIKRPKYKPKIISKGMISNINVMDFKSDADAAMWENVYFVDDVNEKVFIFEK